jgi:hypothetical protein
MEHGGITEEVVSEEGLPETMMQQKSNVPSPNCTRAAG